MLLFGCTPDTTPAAGYLQPPCFSLPALPSLCCRSRGSPGRRRLRRWSPTCRDSMALFPSTWRPGKAPPARRAPGAGRLPVDVDALLPAPVRLNLYVHVTMQVRGDRGGDRGGAVLLLRGVGAEPAHGPLAPVAVGRAPVQRLERTCVSDWSVPLSCHSLEYY